MRATVAFLLPVILAACESVNEPPGGSAMALVNSSGQSIGLFRKFNRLLTISQ